MNHQTTEALRAIGQSNQATLYMTLLSGFNALVHRYTGRADLVIGSPVANRTEPEIEAVIGFFVNTLVLRTDVSGNPSFTQLLKRTRETALAAFAHQQTPFEKLVEELQPRRDRSYNPVFQIMFVLQESMPSSIQSATLLWEPAEISIGTAKFDLTLELFETSEGLTGWLEYSTDLFDGSRMERMARNFETLMEAAAVHPECPIGDLPLLSDPEQNRIIREWNATARPFPDLSVTELFEAQVALHPEKTAVVFGSQRLTYAELNERANQLAHGLRALGVGPDVLVGLCLERSLEMITGILGILKAGGAYVPMDPAYPAERLAFMLQDANCPILLTQQKLLDRLPLGPSNIICLDGEGIPTLDPLPVSGNLRPAPQPGHLAYVIYTSGSTGRPKGVAIEHRSAVALLHWARETYSPDEYAGVLFVTSICFDLSIFEMFVPLSWGGKLILADRPLEWTQLPAAGEVTMVNTVPSLIAEWLRVGELPTSVRTVNLAGEPLAQALVEQIYQQCPAVQKIYDLYGPTEDTVYSTCALRTVGGFATIGRPLSNEQVFLLDSHLQPVPIGVPGELFLGGDGLARGYLNQPELTAEKFIASPFEPGKRLYRTGDLARYLEDGRIEFLGRLDHQVKIRGFRIELGEIEEQLRQHPAIRDALVMAREDDTGEKSLIAYLVRADRPVPEAGELRAFLKNTLPEFMLPSRFLLLDNFPMTPNGKIDRKALPAPDKARPELEPNFAPPVGELENMLAAIWCELLNLEKVGRCSNFFELGGHSLMVTQMISRIRDALEMEVPMRTIFEAPTIAALAQAIEQMLIEEINRLSDEEVERMQTGGSVQGTDQTPRP